MSFPWLLGHSCNNSGRIDFTPFGSKIQVELQKNGASDPSLLLGLQCIIAIIILTPKLSYEMYIPDSMDSPLIMIIMIIF